MIIKLINKYAIVKALLDKNNITAEDMNNIYLKVMKNYPELIDYEWKELYLRDIQNIINVYKK